MTKTMRMTRKMRMTQTKINPVKLDEAKIITKVNSRGDKRRRVKCKPGYKLNSTKTACVPITGSEKVIKRQAVKKMIRNKRSQGPGLIRRANRKRAKAMRKRKALGLTRG